MRTVAGYLCNSRSVVCEADQTLGVSSRRQALLLVLMALTNQGEFGWAGFLFWYVLNARLHLLGYLNDATDDRLVAAKVLRRGKLKTPPNAGPYLDIAVS